MSDFHVENQESLPFPPTPMAGQGQPHNAGVGLPASA